MNYFSLPTVCVGKLENVSLDFMQYKVKTLLFPIVPMSMLMTSSSQQASIHLVPEDWQVSTYKLIQQDKWKRNVTFMIKSVQKFIFCINYYQYLLYTQKALVQHTF